LVTHVFILIKLISAKPEKCSGFRGLKIDKEFEKANFKAKITIDFPLKVCYCLKDGNLGLKRWLFILDDRLFNALFLAASRRRCEKLNFITTIRCLWSIP
jgi:hypothetical protein